MTMTKYLTEVWSLTHSFSRLNVLQVLCAENAQADALVKLASTRALGEGWPLVEMLPTQTIKVCDVSAIEEESSWMDKILHYKTDRTLPTNPRVI